MAGTKAGSMKAALTNKAKHGDDFYKKIGALGGKKGGPRIFNAYDLQRNKLVAALGGLNSSRSRNKSQSQEKQLEIMEKREVILQKIKQLDAEEQR